MTSCSDPGPAPSAHARRSASAEHPVELADVAEGEGPQERAQGGGRHHPVTEHRLRWRPSAACRRGRCANPPAAMACTKRQHLAPRRAPRRHDPRGDSGVDQAFEAEADHQCGHEQQPGVGHQIGLVEGHLDAVDSARYCAH